LQATVIKHPKEIKQMELNTCWHAVYTKPRWEKKVAATLEDRGVEFYCPLNKVIKQWSDRKKITMEPLFKSYVFVKVAEKSKWDLLRVDGIISYVNWLGKPAKIKDCEIATIRKFLKEFGSAAVVESVLEVNCKVKVREGVLMDYQGILIKVWGNKASVMIESMGLQLITLFDKKNLELVC
jgi:transcription antitermination factor NusG